jgi:hypothetical protein
MDFPQFPKDFCLAHCPKVLEERRYRLRYTGERDDEADLQVAECAFVRRGYGLTCENCELHVSPCRRAGGELIYPQDKHHEAIKSYYDAVAAWEKEEKRVQVEGLINGAGI